MVRISSVALTCATFGFLAVTLPGTAAEASRTRLGNNNSTYGDEKLTGNNGVLHCGPIHFVQTDYWYSNIGTTIAGCSATANATLQAVASLKLRPDPTNKCGFHSALWTAGVHMQNETSAPAATQHAATQQIVGRGGWPL